MASPGAACHSACTVRAIRASPRWPRKHHSFHVAARRASRRQCWRGFSRQAGRATEVPASRPGCPAR
eukprot:4683037-Alexandrium_andersonii.AAC.1